MRKSECGMRIFLEALVLFRQVTSEAVSDVQKNTDFLLNVELPLGARMWIADYTHIVDQGWATANITQVEDFRRPYQMSSLVRFSQFFLRPDLD